MTSRILLGVGVLMIVCARPPAAQCDDGILSSKTGFNELVLEAMAARGHVQSASFDYSITYYAKDGDDHEWKQEGHYAFDERSKEFAHRSTITFAKQAENPNPYGGVPGDGIAVQTEDGIQYRGGGIVRDDRAVCFDYRGGKGRACKFDPQRPNSIIVPFDYRSFGFAFYGDINRNSSFEAVLSNYLLVPNEKMPELNKSELPKAMQPVKKDARYFNYGGCVLCIEPERDYWVTRSRLTIPSVEKNADGSEQTRAEVGSDCTVYLEQFKKWWLPVRVLYRSHDRRLDFKIKWDDVNAKEGAIEFSIDRLSAELQKPAP